MFEMEAEVYCSTQDYFYHSSDLNKEDIFIEGSLVRLYQREFEIKPMLKSNFTSITYYFDL